MCLFLSISFYKFNLARKINSMKESFYNCYKFIHKFTLSLYPFLSNTHTDLGLDFVRQQAFTKSHGDRDNVNNILIVITDGQSSEPPKTSVKIASI